MGLGLGRVRIRLRVRVVAEELAHLHLAHVEGRAQPPVRECVMLDGHQQNAPCRRHEACEGGGVGPTVGGLDGDEGALLGLG